MSFVRQYRAETSVSLTAPELPNAKFLRWKKNGVLYSTDRDTTLVMPASNTAMEANYLVGLPTCGYELPDIETVGTALRFTGNGSTMAVLVSEEQINLSGEGGFIDLKIANRGSGSSDPGLIFWNTGNDVQIGLLSHSDWVSNPCVLSQFYAFSFDASLGQAGILPNIGANPFATDDSATHTVEIQSGDTTVRYYKDGVLMAGTDTVNEPVHLVVLIGSNGSIDLLDSSFSFQS